MQNAELLLSHGTVDYAYQNHVETSAGNLYYRGTEAINEDGDARRIAEFRIESPEDKTTELLSSFMFHDGSTAYTYKGYGEKPRSHLDSARNVCVERLMEENIPDDESAILLFIIREYTKSLERIPNDLPFVIEHTWDAKSPVNAIYDFCKTRPDRVTETITYANRRDNGDYIEVSHTKTTSQEGDVLSVQTDVEYRHGQSDTTYYITCQDDKHEEMFAYAFDSYGEAVVYGDAGNTPYEANLDHILQIITDELSSQERISSDTHHLQSPPEVSSPQEFAILLAQADNDWLDYDIAPIGSMTETIAREKHKRSFRQIKEAFERLYDLCAVSEYDDTIIQTPIVEEYLHDNFVKLKINLKHLMINTEATETSPLVIANAQIEMFYIDTVKLREHSFIHGQEGGVGVKAFFKISRENIQPVYIRGCAYLKDITVID